MTKTKQVLAIAAVCSLLAAGALGQNYTQVTATDIKNQYGTKLATGKLCFLGTNASDVPINYRAGGGGQVISKPSDDTVNCKPVTTGAVTPFDIDNPALTAPANIRYRIWTKDKNNNTVIMYRNVVVSGATFDLDAYIPTTSNLSTGQSVTNLTVQDITITGTCTGDGCGTGGGGTTPDATASVKGKVKLAGDFGGTADLPTVPGLSTKVATSTTVNGHALSSNVTVSKSDVGLGSVPNTDATNASNISSGTLGAARLPQEDCGTGNYQYGRDVAGAPLCRADQLGAEGGGITSLNGDTGASQSFLNGPGVAVTTNTTDHTHTIGLSSTSITVNGQSCALGSTCTVADSTKVPTSRTVNTKALSADITLTTSDVADSTNKRYVTDAYLTLLGLTSGTNTGDQVVPANSAAVASNFLTAYNNATGAWTRARPTCANLSDAGSLCTSSANLVDTLSEVLAFFTGTPSSGKFLAYDGSWQAPSAGLYTAANNASAVAGSKVTTGTCTWKVNTDDLWESDCGLKVGGATGIQNWTAVADPGTPAVGDDWYSSTTAGRRKFYNGALKVYAFTDDNITGTAAGLSGTPALPNGTTATTQSAGDNSTKVATTAYVNAALSAPWTAGFSYNGIPPASTYLLDEIIPTYTPAAVITLAANCSGSTFKARVAATGSTALVVAKNGSTICTATVGAAGTTATWTGTGSTTTLTSADEITIIGGGDATLSGITMALAGVWQ